jgi:hypothetical protein
MAKPRGRHRSPKKLTTRQRREIEVVEKECYSWWYPRGVENLAKRGYITIEEVDCGYPYIWTSHHATNKGRAALGLDGGA